jgi:hypothetical protein
MRMVIAGISGSSMLDTDARTSGNGESSSSFKASKSKPILGEVRISKWRSYDRNETQK